MQYSVLNCGSIKETEFLFGPKRKVQLLAASKHKDPACGQAGSSENRQMLWGLLVFDIFNVAVNGIHDH